MQMVIPLATRRFACERTGRFDNQVRSWEDGRRSYVRTKSAHNKYLSIQTAILRGVVHVVEAVVDL